MLAPDTNVLTAPSVDRAYSDPAWWYDVRGFFILKLAYRGSLWGQVRFFEENLAERHLELAVGTGTLFDMVLKRRRHRQGRLPGQIVGIDYAPTMLAAARRRLHKHAGLQLAVGDAARLEHGAAAFDSVNVANAFHCFHEPELALREIFRVLAPGGRLAMNVLTPARGWAPARWLADRIGAWGQRKGILVAPHEPASVSARLRDAGFLLEHEQQQGNACFFRASRPR